MSILVPNSLSLSSSSKMLFIIVILLVWFIRSGLGGDLSLANPLYDNKNPKNPTCLPSIQPLVPPVTKTDIDILQFAQNVEHLEADFFLWGALGFGLDKVAPELALGGPPPVGARKANLDNLTKSIIEEFGYEEVGHLRIIKETVGSIPRPLIDLSPQHFANIVNQAFESDLQPPFDPYKDSLSFLLASYLVPYVGLNGYVGANPLIQGYVTRRLLAGLLGVESGQDATIRTYLYEKKDEIVHPYNYTVAEFTNRFSTLRNKLGVCGNKDEGIVVQPRLGAEGRTPANVLSANADSISYARSPAEILRILYGTGDEHIPGGFYPKGGNGNIATTFLEEP